MPCFLILRFVNSEHIIKHSAPLLPNIEQLVESVSETLFFKAFSWVRRLLIIPVLKIEKAAKINRLFWVLTINTAQFIP